MNTSFLKKSLISLLAAGTLLTLAGCNNNGGGGGGGVVIIDPIAYAWFDVYGNGCATGEPRPGCNYFWYDGQLVKMMDFEDPYFNDYYYNLTYDYYTFYLNGVLYEYSGWAWISPTGIIYDEYGNALNQRNGRGRDVVADVAKQEEDIVLTAGKDFAARYSLSEEKGVQIARSLNEWAKLGKERAKTDADLAEFSQKLYGVDYSQVKAALEAAVAGNNEALKATVAEAAKNWGTSEENMKDVLKGWYKNVPGLE